MHLIGKCYFVMKPVCQHALEAVNVLTKRLVSTAIAILNDFQLLLAKLSQILDGFLPFPQVTRLVEFALELIHFKDLVKLVL